AADGKWVCSYPFSSIIVGYAYLYPSVFFFNLEDLLMEMLPCPIMPGPVFPGRFLCGAPGFIPRAGLRNPAGGRAS
ncbi:MAG: hypothetical protein ACQETR_13565, partial [Thermodesulfobacteriota bacterium]